MTMVHKLRSRALRPVRVAGRLLVAAQAWMALAASLPGQTSPVHCQHACAMPPGAIGSAQLERGGPLPGYFQPVAIRAPQGTRIATVEAGTFSDDQPAPVTLGLLIGATYRLRVTGIPQQEGLEVYPTIVVLDQLHPPAGREFEFPIEIEITQEELEMALDGKFVTRVIYLEEPADALPVGQRPGEATYFEVGEGDDPLTVADGLGRPMAILRMGARLPDAEGTDQAFYFGSPPLLRWHPRTAPVYTQQDGPYARSRLGTLRPTSGTIRPRATVYRGNDSQ